MNQNTKDSTIAAGYVIGNAAVADGHFLLAIALPVSFPAPAPGQFVMLRNLQNGQSLLSRPFSVHGFRKDGKQSTIELLCRVAGRETLLLSRLGSGAKVEILGPLGKGFVLAQTVKRLILLAGGVGAAPLAFFIRELGQKAAMPSVNAFLGAKNAGIVTALGSRFAGLCSVRFATDDGSFGHHGTVTDILSEELQRCDYETTQILSCGPSAMTRELVRVLGDRPVSCQVSLEERMACGVGACLGCVVATKNGQGDTIYKRVCKDGPVFDLRELVWDPPV
jgi:dihydroorotate dehydrogenase electron transfer subunit